MKNWTATANAQEIMKTLGFNQNQEVPLLYLLMTCSKKKSKGSASARNIFRSVCLASQTATKVSSNLEEKHIKEKLPIQISCVADSLPWIDLLQPLCSYQIYVSQVFEMQLFGRVCALLGEEQNKLLPIVWILLLPSRWLSRCHQIVRCTMPVSKPSHQLYILQFHRYLGIFTNSLCIKLVTSQTYFLSCVSLFLKVLHASDKKLYFSFSF